MATRQNFEHDEQKTLFEWIDRKIPQHPILKLIFAVPNGGMRHPAVAIKLKKEGVRKGVPDVCVMVPRRHFHGLFIEMKWGKGRASPEQAEWHELLEAQGYKVDICRSWIDAAVLICEYLGLPPPLELGSANHQMRGL